MAPGSLCTWSISTLPGGEALVVGDCLVARCKSFSLSKDLCGFVVLLTGSKEKAQLCQACLVKGTQACCLPAGLDRIIDLPLGLQRGGKVSPGSGIVGVGLEELLHPLTCSRDLSRFKFEHCEVLLGEVHFRVARNERTKHGTSFIESPLLHVALGKKDQVELARIIRCKSSKFIEPGGLVTDDLAIEFPLSHQSGIIMAVGSQHAGRERGWRRNVRGRPGTFRSLDRVLDEVVSHLDMDGISGVSRGHVAAGAVLCFRDGDLHDLFDMALGLPVAGQAGGTRPFNHLARTEPGVRIVAIQATRRTRSLPAGTCLQAIGMVVDLEDGVIRRQVIVDVDEVVTEWITWTVGEVATIEGSNE